MNYEDKAWCASPNCKNKCGRKLTEHDKQLAEAIGQDEYMSYSYFCGYPEDMSVIERMKVRFYYALDVFRKR